MKERRRWVLAGLAAAGVAALALAPLVGAAPLGSTVVREIRLPRVLLAFLAGAGLSLAGMTFQALFRNPLASPFTLGVSSGAALGAALAIRLGLTFSVLGISLISLAAFGGALKGHFVHEAAIHQLQHPQVHRRPRPPIQPRARP